MPPCKSGIADYSAVLISELEKLVDLTARVFGLELLDLATELFFASDHLIQSSEDFVR